MLIGRLTRKPKSGTSATGHHEATFTVATNYAWREAETTDRKDVTEFHRVVVSGKLASIALTYLEKSSRVYIEGRLADHDIIADEIIMLGSLKTEPPK